MMRGRISLGLSLLTIFGGHYYNNRWDRASFFTALFLVWCMAAGVIGTLLSGLFGTGGATATDVVRSWWITWSGGLLAIWIASCFVAVRDSKVSAEQGRFEPRFENWFASTTMSVIGILAILSIPAGWLIQDRPATRADRERASEVVTTAPPLPQAETEGYLGSTSMYDTDFRRQSKKVLTEGPGIIRGEALVNGRPCSGLKLRLFLGADLRSQWTTTNDTGYYELRVPVGKYRYVGFELDKESADQVLPRKIMKADSIPTTGMISVDRNRPAQGPRFEFIDPVVALRPGAGSAISSTNPRFEWKPYPKAAYYKLQILDHGTNRWSTKWEPVFAWRDRPVVQGTSVSLEELGVTLQSGHFYSWKVEAFAESGTKLSETPHRAMGDVFEVE